MTTKNDPEQERAEFEEKFPVPDDCQWCGDGYAPTEFNAWEAKSYADKFKGWMGRAALQSQEYTSAIGEAGQAYMDSFKYAHPLPVQFRWSELWEVMCAAANEGFPQSQVENDTTLFCDLKTDEEKSAFFLSGRGYETGVIAQAIQNDVAMAYHRCAEYKKELESLQSQDKEDAGYESGRRCGLGFAHSVVSEILRKHYHGSGVEGLNKLIQQAADVIATEMDNPTTATTDIDHARRIEGGGK